MRRLHLLLSPLLLALAVAALVPAAGPVAAASAQQQVTPLAVTGRGRVEARPDRVEIGYVLQRDGASRELARGSVARRARALLRRLRAIGVDPAGIRLSRIAVGRRSGRPGLRRPFRAIGVVAARTDRVALAGRMTDLAGPVGADVDGPDYDLVDDVAPREAATARAVASARGRAEAVARGLGLRIVAVRAVSLDGASIAAPQSSASGAPGTAGSTAPSGPTTPTAPGRITVRATVTVTFELAP